MSEPRLLWRVAPLWAKVFVVTTGFWLVLLTAVRLPWAATAQNFRLRRIERVSLAPLLVEARRDALTFPQVVVSHPAYVNKTVYWSVTVTSGTSYAEGRPAWPVVWTNLERVKSDNVYESDRVLARVAAVREDVVYLDYLGRP